MQRGRRQEQVAALVQEGLANALRSAHDAALRGLTITEVRLTPDLQRATVFYALLEDDEELRRRCERSLSRANGFLRSRLAERVQLRKVPELHFRFDRTSQEAARLETIFRGLEQERRSSPTEDES